MRSQGWMGTMVIGGLADHKHKNKDCSSLLSMLTSTNKGICFTLLTSFLALITIETVILLGPLLLDVHALKTEISDQTNATSSNTNKNLRNGIERRLPYEELDSIRPPFVSPNPVGPPGQVSFRANETGVGKGVESVNISIKGPNLGSTNPLLSPKTIGSLSMIPLSNTSQDGSWTGNFSFPPSLPDGNYVYSLTTRDRTGLGEYYGFFQRHNT